MQDASEIRLFNHSHHYSMSRDILNMGTYYLIKVNHKIIITNKYQTSTIEYLFPMKNYNYRRGYKFIKLQIALFTNSILTLIFTNYI